MLNGHIDWTYFHIYAKIKPTAMSTSKVIAIYMLETNMPLTFCVYAKYFMSICGGMFVHICHF